MYTSLTPHKEVLRYDCKEKKPYYLPWSGSHGSWRAKWSRLTLPAWLLGRLHHLVFCSSLCTICQVLHTMLGCVSVTFSSTSAQDTSTNHSAIDSVPTNQRTAFRGNWQRTTKQVRSCAIWNCYITCVNFVNTYILFNFPYARDRIPMSSREGIGIARYLTYKICGRIA